ncbi:MAG: ATP-binding protein [Polyangiaceae bacterium]
MVLRWEPAEERPSARERAAPRGRAPMHTGAIIHAALPVFVVTLACAALASSTLDARAVLEASAAALTAAATSWIYARRVAARVERVAAGVERSADGGAATLEHAGDDEISSLVELERLTGAVERRRVETERELASRAAAAAEERARLEHLLSARTAELAERTLELRHVLEHVPVGILTIDADGRMGPDWSLAAECLLGVPDADARLSAHLSAVDPTFARRFELGWEQVSAGILPVELALDQLPKQLQVGHHHFRTSFVPIQGTRGEPRYLIVIEETTAALERREEEEANLELATSLARFLKDREAFAEFLAEGEELATCIVASTSADRHLRHALHTLKGNALMMGLEPIAHHCHLLESLMAATGDVPALEAREQLRRRVQRLSAVYRATEGAADARADIRRADLDALIDAAQRAAPHAEVLRRALDLLHEPVSTRFDRLVDQTARLAARLGLAPPTCSVVGGSIRLDRRRYARFWSALGHVARNALTHGIEAPGARVRDGKPQTGSIVFAAFATESELVIEVRDDGRGIDWDSVRERALALGLPSETRQELVGALFADGLSTASSTDDLAGRGVGLGAVHSAVADLDGTITVDSTPHVGTCFRFAFPRSGAACCEGPKSRWRPNVAVSAP